MIASIKGTIRLKRESFLVLENQGIGYKVFVPESVLLKGTIDDELELFTYQHVREDALQLFGFSTLEDLELFEKLISVSGVGPKTGLNVFGVASAKDIKSAIINDNPNILKKVSGIGAKTAERIVLELKNKIAALAGYDGIKTSEELDVDSDVVDALVSLGYQPRQAQEALKKIDPEIKESGAKVKVALKFLTK